MERQPQTAVQDGVWRPIHRRGRLIGRLALAVAALALAGSAASGAARANCFTVQCQILDPVTAQPKKAYAPGDEVMLRLFLDLPDDAMREAAQITAFARVKVAGLKFWAELGDGELRVPAAANRAAIPGLEDFEAAIPQGVLQEEIRIVRLPDKLPRADVTIKVEVAVDGFDQQSCRQDARIQP